MKKVLFTATVDSHIKHFHIPYLKYFKEQGYEVHVATNGTEEIPYCDKKIYIPFERSPFKLNNIKAIKELKKVLKKEKYNIIHTHTPMGSVVTRLAALNTRKKNNTKVIYTAHGFHFYKGAPTLNWALFYPVEKFLSKYTDVLITINKEDYNLAKNKFKKCRQIHFVPGVGIDENKFNFEMTDKEKKELRVSLGLKDDDFILIYPAELNKNKNQIFLINVMNELIKKYSNIHLLLPGKDSYNGYYQKIVKELNLDNNIHILGYRTDIHKLLKISDLSVAASIREGLPVNIMEAMYVGLPTIAIDSRGTRDLVKNNINGYITNQNDRELFINKIELLYKNKELNNNFKQNNKKLVKEYMLDNVINQLIKIYENSLKLKVLHLLSSTFFSGAENVACQIINLTKDNYEMYYCSPIGNIKNTLKNKNINYIPIKKMNAIYLKKIVKQYNIDIIHAHDVKASFIASFLNKRIISHIHGNHLYMRKITIQSLLYKIRFKKFEHIFWVSDSAFENFIFKNKICNKSSILYNVINEKDVRNKIKQDKKAYDFDIIFLGRLNEAKNPKRMIRLLHEIVLKRKETRCAIVGDGEYFDEIKDYIFNNNLERNVEMFGYQNNPYKILFSSKLMLMTSIHEGLPMVVLEAMSLGIPIISTPTDGIIKFIDGKNGFLSNYDYELIEKILYILQCKSLEIKNINNYVVKKFKEINNLEKYKLIIKEEYEKGM